MLSINPVVDNYIQGVLDGEVIVGQWIRKAIDRHLRDLERGHERGLWFDPAAANFVIDFIQTFCIPSAQSEPMKLMPWQQMVLAITYGWKRQDGTRKHRRLLLEVAKKQGKTGLAASLALFHLVADNEPSARVFIAATALKQARECFTEAINMRNKSPELQRLVQQSGNSPVTALHVPQTASRLTPMARGADSQDGAVVSCAILDELHRWKTTDTLWPILRYGGDTRKQPLLVCITTAGSSAGGTSLCWGEHEYGCKILDGVIEDDEVCPFIFSLDPKDDWQDEANWIKANPSLGVLVPLTALRNQYKEAIGKPHSLGEYKRYRLNIWSSEAADPAVEISEWDECCRVPATYPDAKKLRAESLEKLKGRTCYAGLDLAPKIDTSSLVLVFPPIAQGEKWHVIPWFWIPRGNIADRVKRDRVPYDRWQETGFLTATPGNVTDVRYIAQQIVTINKDYNLKELAYDAAYSNELVRMLEEEGFPMDKFVSHPQTNMKMNGPCHEWLRKVLRRELSHDADPVLRWQVGNLRWNTMRSSGFIRPDKDKAREKVDGCSAMIMALGRATDPANVVKPKPRFFMVTSE